MTEIVAVPAGEWHEQVRIRLAAGGRFATLYACQDGSVRCVIVARDGTEVILQSPVGAVVRSIVDLTPAADWPEREAHDLFGIRFEGHEPMRPLVGHSGEWRVPVTGEGVHEIAVGPIHAGVIESGHFRIHAVGELMLLVDVRLFYKHRGLEQAARGLSLRDALPLVQRACAGCAVTNTVAYSLAAEQLLGHEASSEEVRVRTLLLELERMWNHLNDLSAICAGVGFALGSAAFAALKEEAQRLNARLFGHRFLFGSVAVGGGEPGRTRGRMTGELAADALGTLAEISVGLDTAWHAVAFNASVQDRMRGTGVITRKVAVRQGAVGPAARASGVANDVRATSSGLAYDGFVPATVERADGDVAARAALRRAELSAGIELMRRLLRELATAAVHRSPTPGPGRDVGPTEGSTAQVTGFAVARVEGPRGETVCCVEARDGRIHRLHVRTASYANWPLVAQAAEGNLVGEFPLINKSFELCYACVDR